MPKLRSLDDNLAEAAMDLGAPVAGYDEGYSTTDFTRYYLRRIDCFYNVI